MITISHYRHATSIILFENKKILIDPLFAGKGTYPPIQMTGNRLNNPLTDLPVNYHNLSEVDGVIITHDHNDHFDVLAKKNLPKHMPILCQIEDYKSYTQIGFTNVTPVSENVTWLGFDCRRITGTHGGGILKKALGISSAYFLQTENHSLYISGDTLYTSEIEKILREIKPEILILFGGGAKMKIAGRITMNHNEILSICKLLPESKIIAVHMDALNHCFDTREKLRRIIPESISNLFIPEDGETLGIT